MALIHYVTQVQFEFGAIRLLAQGLPSGLAAMGVSSGQFERIITGALADHCHKTNPRVASADDYRDLLEQSM